MTEGNITGSESQYRTIMEIRDGLANTMLLCIAIIGAPLLFISFLRYFKLGGISMIAIHSGVYFLCIITTAYRKKIPLRIKANIVAGSSLIIAVTSILKWGIIASGASYFIFCSILVTLFFGIRPGLLITCINITFLAITGFLYATGKLHVNFDIEVFSTALPTWISIISVYGCFTTVLIICLAKMHASMAVSIKNLENRTSELNNAKQQREMEIETRKHAETAHIESEKRFRTVLENLPCAVSVHDLEGRHLIVNEETCRKKGYTREELFKLTVMETAGPAMGQNYDIKDLWNNIKTGDSFTFETPSQRKDGSTYESEVHLTKMMLEGQPVILSLVFDITDRKKIEDDLARHSDLDRLISEISSKIVGLSHFEVDTYIEEALGIIGKETGVGHAYLFLFHPDNEEIVNITEWAVDDQVPLIGNLQDLDQENEMQWFKEKLNTQEIVHIPDINELPPEAEYEKNYFSKQQIKSLLVMVIRQGENLLGYLGFDSIYEKRCWTEDEMVILRLIGETFLNAIQRKLAEKEQEKLQAQLSTSIELANLGPWEYDVANGLFIFNDHFYRIYRTSAEEMGGYTMTFREFEKRFVHPDDTDFSADLFQSGLETGIWDYIGEEHKVIYADGETGYVITQVFISRDNKGNPVKIYGVNQDITEWKTAQEKLRESEEKLVRSKKMESLGLLAGGVAHDLNNVLSGIVSYPELILLDLPKDSPLRKPIETIQASGNRAVAIVHDLLTIARGAATTKEPINLNSLIEEYMVSPECNNLKMNNPSVKIKADLEPELFNFRGSLIHIKKVIMNLVSNASEAIENEGTVMISTSNRYIDTPLSRYEDVKTGEYIVLSVTDNGPGILPENLDRIFEPFFTKKVMGISGTGLGLTVVWNTVQDHYGYIDVSSDKNGTKFELYFPITREELPGRASTVSLNQIKGNGETILVVDDIESQREISCRMLEMLGYNHIDFSSGEEAIEYLRNKKADLILLDMIMTPGISGRETYEQIVKIHPGQKAVIVSGYTETEDVLATQKLGAGSYLKKPFTLEALGRGIKDELSS